MHLGYFISADITIAHWTESLVLRTCVPNEITVTFEPRLHARRMFTSQQVNKEVPPRNCVDGSIRRCCTSSILRAFILKHYFFAHENLRLYRTGLSRTRHFVKMADCLTDTT
jgi:hypothetical protein